jgi:branched-chain amino acid transport system ATP-binding protein
MSALRVDGLTGGYGHLTVLRDLSLSAAAGRLTLIAGPNGAGKTTLLLFLMGALRPTAGRVVLGDEDLTELGVRDRMRHGIAMIPDGRGLFPSLTVRENLRVAGTAMGLGKPGTADAIERAAGAFPIIAERMDQRVGQLSGGQQQMVAIGRGLMADPRVLLLDEPSTGLAPIVWREVLDTCRRLAGEGKTVVLVEQRILDAIAAADHCVVIQQGRVVRDGPAQEMSQDPALFHDYIAVRSA